MKSDDPVTGSTHQPQQHQLKTKGRPLFFVFALVAMSVVLFGASVSAAQSSGDDAELATTNQRDVANSEVGGSVVEPTSEQVEVLQDELAESEEEVDALEGQLDLLRQAMIGIGSQEPEESLTPALDESGVDRRSVEFQEHSQTQWQIGYSLGGGENLSAFVNTILPCESGSQPDPDRAVGPTDDWGRSQINRPVWKARFESLTGANFEENISDPVLNGFMAAHIEQEQGLSAWTCWRIR